MNKSSVIAVLILALSVLSAPTIRAQGTTTYLSNLGQAGDGSLAVGTNSWVAIAFYTGTNASHYEINSIQLAMADATGAPSNIKVMIGLPAAGTYLPYPSSRILGTLSGSLDPTTSGIYTYTPTTTIPLSGGYPYCIVLTSDTLIANGAYEWSYANTDTYQASEGWSFGGVWTDATGKGAWIAINSTFPLFAVSATAVPEPSLVVLLALGGLCLLCRRRKVATRAGKPSFPAILILLLALSSAPTVRAQGTTTYLSNLGQARAGSLAVGTNSWVAIAFYTGTNASHYEINSIQLAMADATGAPSNIKVMISLPAAGAGFVIPGPTFLGTLSGSLDPTTSGIYTYTPATTITLLGGYPYCIVLTADTLIANGAYEWSYANTDTYQASEGWSFGGVWTSSTSVGYQRAPSGTFPLFAVSATAVPEPSSVVLLALGGLCFLCRRRKA